jgi:hypothetical protein
MKKILSLLVFSVFFLIAAAAYAHPPYDIKITLDPKTKMLEAVIMHNVSNPLNHYIKRVEVCLNGKVVIVQNLFHQDSSDSQTVRYLIPDAKDGDMISVEGECSITGELKKEIRARL